MTPTMANWRPETSGSTPHRGKGNTNKMDDKDDEWADDYLPESESALSARMEVE